jgi:hypothetical protein
MDVQAPAFRPRLSGVLAVILEGAAAVFFCVCLPVSFVVCVCVGETCVCVCVWNLHVFGIYLHSHLFFYMVSYYDSRVAPGVFFVWECYHSVVLLLLPGGHREYFWWRVLSLTYFLFFFVLVYYIIESYLYLNYNFSHSSDLIRFLFLILNFGVFKVLPAFLSLCPAKLVLLLLFWMVRLFLFIPFIHINHHTYYIHSLYFYY